ncbi:hypothetical protein [Bartonella sp. DGB2]|uniref:hypothetical protein n=1 Tax=Bartonella sp. DGB2 TaxID=3388426 RepID=UPI00398FB87D
MSELELENNSNVKERRALFSKRLGVSKAYITQLVKKGLPTSDDGQFILVDEALAWIKANIAPAYKKSKVGEVVNLDLNEVKSRLTLAQAEKVEFELKVKKQDYVPIDYAKRQAFVFARSCRDMLMLFPSRHSGDIASALECDHNKVAIVLEQHMRDALIELDTIPMPDFAKVDEEEESDNVQNISEYEATE